MSILFLIWFKNLKAFLSSNTKITTTLEVLNFEIWFYKFRNLFKIIGWYLSVKSEIKITGVNSQCTAYFIIAIVISTKYRISTKWIETRLHHRNSIFHQETLTIEINWIVNINWIKKMSNKQTSLSFVSRSLFWQTW